MAGYSDSGYRTFLAGTALEKGRVVKITGDNTVGYAGVADDPIGVTADRQATAGQPVMVKLINSEGTFEAKCAAAATGLTAGAPVGSTNANGEIGVAANGATKLLWQLARAATADKFTELVLK